MVQRNRAFENQDTGIQIQTGSQNNISLLNRSWNNGDHGFDHINSTGSVHVGDVAYGNFKDGFSTEGNSTGNTFYNCIAVDNGLASNEYNFWVDAGSTAGLVSDYNLFWNSNGAAPIKYGTTIYPTLAAFIAATGKDVHSIQADPRFVNAAQGDLQLLPGSPAIDSGTSGVANWPAIDAEGRTRSDDPSTPNTGVGPIPYSDRGALEYLGGAPGNRPPIVGAPSSVSGSEGTLIAVTVTATDPDGDAITSLTASLSGLPSGHNASFTASADKTAGTFTWTPGFSHSGSYNVSFTATNALSGSATTSIQVQNSSRPPAVTAPSTRTVSENNQLVMTVTASDPDGPSISSFVADFSNLPAGHNATFSTNSSRTSGTFRWTPTYAHGRALPYNVVFRASNALTGEDTTAITVTDVAHTAPVVTAPSSYSVAEGSLATVNVTASDVDGDVITSLTANLANLPSGHNAVFTPGPGNTSGTLTWTPGFTMLGDYGVTFTAVSDRSGSRVTTMQVTNTPTAPQVTAPAAASGNENSPLTVIVTAKDPDGDPIDVLSADLTALPPGHNAVFTKAAGNLSGTLTWTPTAADGREAPYIVSFSATNGPTGHANTALTIANSESPPVVTAPATVSVAENGLLSLTVSASDPNGQPITSLTANLDALPAGNTASFSVNPDHTSGTLTWTPTYLDAGGYGVSFTASNAMSGTAQTTIQVTNQDRPPTVTAPANVSVAENGQLTVVVSASDPDGSAISSLIANLGALPAGHNAVFVPAAGNGSGTLTWTPTYNDSGSRVVTFTAANALVGNALTTVRITNADRSPVLGAPANVSAAENGQLSVVVTASDPDGDALTLTANLGSLPAGHNAVFTRAPGNSSGTLTWTPTYSDAGIRVVIFTATNAQTRTALTTINIANTNRSPAVLAPNSVSGVEGTRLEVHVTASDVDADAITSLTADLSTLPAGSDAVFTPGAGNTSGTLSWTPTVHDAGIHRVSFRAANGMAKTRTTAISVGNLDHPPVFDVPTDVNGAESNTISVLVDVADPDGDPVGSLTADLSKLPAGSNAVFSVSPTKTSGVLTWTPRYEDAGSYDVTFHASSNASAPPGNGPGADGKPAAMENAGVTEPGSDTGGGGLTWASTLVKIVVANVDRAPVVAAPESVTVNEGVELGFEVTASDVDGDTLVLSADLSDLPAGDASFSPSGNHGSGTLTWTPAAGDSGRYEVRFMVSAGGMADTVLTTIKVGVAGLVSAAKQTQVERTASGAAEIAPGLASRLGTFGAFVVPNPIHGRGAIDLVTTRPGRIVGHLIDPGGRRVRTLVDRSWEAGYHRLELDGRDDQGRPLPVGAYFYRIQAPEGIISGRFAIMR